MQAPAGLHLFLELLRPRGIEPQSPPVGLEERAEVRADDPRRPPSRPRRRPSRCCDRDLARGR
ncbi:hypothetical protein Ga0080559_TMP916 [Salipiger profundus]|uniref:Uncharacterized protein n=1 Tax=Salipiger profundus TaxID=1229727 RepID=A0A1U7D0Q0_9RHOB|nr:hypothetical protein Ga0080559_TMP916 [Salipiger profundus]